MSQMKRAQNCFELFDENKDGMISKDELENAIKVLGVGKEKNIEKTVDNLMQMIDADNSETIDFDEFSTKFSEICAEKPKENELKKIFKLFDKDKNKIIDLEELKNVISNFKKELNEEELNVLCEDIIKQLTNGNTEIGESGEFIF